MQNLSPRIVIKNINSFDATLLFSGVLFALYHRSSKCQWNFTHFFEQGRSYFCCVHQDLQFAHQLVETQT